MGNCCESKPAARSLNSSPDSVLIRDESQANDDLGSGWDPSSRRGANPSPATRIRHFLYGADIRKVCVQTVVLESIPDKGSGGDHEGGVVDVQLDRPLLGPVE